ncbi:MAG: hypothetical protein ACXWKN_15720, partial [Phenylobacterium sp.]
MGAAAIPRKKKESYFDRKRREAKVALRTWPVIATASVAMFIVGAMTADPSALLKQDFDAHDLSRPIASAFGASALAGLLIGGSTWLVVYFALVRQRNRRAGLRHFFILVGLATFAHLAVVLAPVYGALTRDTRQEDLARVGIVESYRRLQSGAGAIDRRPLAHGDAGVIEGFVRTNLGRSLDLHQAYLGEIRAAGLESIFSESNLGSDANLARTDAKLRDIADIVDKYRRLSLMRADQITAEAERLPVSDASRRSVLDGIAEARPRQDAELKQAWNNEAAIVAEYQGAAGLLRAARGHWGFANGKLVFERQADLNAFRGHLSNVGRIVEEEKSLQAR